MNSINDTPGQRYYLALLSRSPDAIMELLVGLALILYFVPTAIAMKREAKSTGYITLVNAFLGWTIAGWVAALLWAVLSPSEKANPAKQP